MIKQRKKFVSYTEQKQFNQSHNNNKKNPKAQSVMGTLMCPLTNEWAQRLKWYD